MKQIFLLSLALCFLKSGFSQKNSKAENDLLKEFSENACKCIDSISTYNKASELVKNEVTACLDKQVVAYQLGSMLLKLDAKNKKSRKKVEIQLSDDRSSEQYQQYYFELENYTMKNCAGMRTAVSSENTQSDHSYSKDAEAMDFYHKGEAAYNSKDYTKAIDAFKNAVRIDSMFSFAWDNLGICYRKTDQYDEALKAYRKSIVANPQGRMPWQNIAVVYEFQKEYQKAIDAYQQLSLLDKDNPEVFYGIGRIYIFKLQDYEKGLDNICTAYRIYETQKSPFRSDAETIIGHVYSEMKKQGKDKRFYEILKAHNISTN